VILGAGNTAKDIGEDMVTFFAERSDAFYIPSEAREPYPLELTVLERMRLSKSFGRTS
jgi:hypothetical protein